MAWLNPRVIDSYTAVFDREATVLVKALYDASKGGTVPVNPQVCLFKGPDGGIN